MSDYLLRAHLKTIGLKAQTKRGAKRLIKKELAQLKKTGVLMLDEKNEMQLLNEMVNLVWFTGE